MVVLTIETETRELAFDPVILIMGKMAVQKKSQPRRPKTFILRKACFQDWASASPWAGEFLECSTTG